MADFTLVIGNKNYSSWSLRGWLMARMAGIAFDEIVVPLDLPETQASIRKHSPSGRVPVLLHRGLAVWESLAIAEYLHDLKPEAGLWPAAPAARAHARAVAAEMHSGFQPLRRQLPMNMWRPVKARALDAEASANVTRIDTIFGECLAKSGGPFLFGAFGAADAMFAPVVARFHTYAVEVGAPARSYMNEMVALPAWREWRTAALHEPWVLPHDEVDWPDVPKVRE
jgi:glutathione S-transferase